MSNATSRASLTRLLIDERAERIAATRVCRACLLTPYASQSDRDQARREIEAEVLMPAALAPTVTNHIETRYP